MRYLFNSAGSARSVFFTLVVFLFCLFLPDPLLAEEYGTISGAVYENDGVTPIAGLRVSAYGNGHSQGCGGPWLGSARTDEQGNYIITELLPGDIYVKANPISDDFLYTNDWWTGTGSPGSTDCEDAYQLILQGGEAVEDIDFSLAASGSISGRIFETDGETPIAGLHVHAKSEACGGGTWLNGADTDESGYYTIPGIPAGTAYVSTRSSRNDLPFVDATYDGGTGSRDCNQEVGIEVTAGEIKAGINFHLEAGVTISGRVTDTQGNPTPDVWIEAFDSLCGYNYLGGGRTDDQGYYTTRTVPPGNIYIRACPECDDHMFRNTWWTGIDSSGSTNCRDALNLNLQAGTNADSIDFSLEYPILVEITRNQRSDGTFDTWYGIYFFNFDNFDLNTVVSITMTGPSGTPVYHYNREGDDQNDFVQNQWNGFHVEVVGVEPEVGVYTFTVVTDAFSTVFTHVRKENKIMPVVDSGTLSPADGSVITSRVPVFEWGSIENPQVPVYYRFQLYDDTGYRVYASDRNAGMSSFALPEGLLEPGRTYSWQIQINDTSDYTRIENLSMTEHFTITMADSFTPGTNPSAIDLEGWGAVHSSRSDYDATLCWIEVVDHDGIAYDGSSHQVTVTFNGETHPLYHVRSDSAYIANYEYWDSNIPAPAGEYVFSVTDPDGNITTLSETLEVNPVAVPDHNTFNVIPDGTSPTITWDAVPDAGRYRIRIYDMNWNIVWHGYPRIQSDPSYTVPPGVLQPNTSYRYRIRSWNQHYPYNFDNESVSDYRTFSTGEESVSPFIEEWDGAATRNSGDQGNRLYFWVKIHDAQGVPDDIQSVTATFPDGTTVPLSLHSGAGIVITPHSESATSGFYSQGDLEISFTSGDYTITVEDLAGNTHSVTDTLDVNPVGYPADETVHASVNGTRVDVAWEAVDDAAFYRLEINDMEGERLFNLGTTENAYTIPAGYLPENTPYQYRITAWREFFSQGVDNSSQSVMKEFETGSNRNMDIQTVILTATDAETTIAGGDSAAVYGTAAPNHVTVESGAYVELVNFPGSNLIEFQSEAAMFMVSRSGTVVTFQGFDGTTLKIPATTNEQTIMFNNDAFARVLRIQDNQVKLDDQEISLTPVAILDDNEMLTGLISYWNFNKGSGLTASDTSPAGNENTGTLVNNPQWFFGPTGNALNFDAGSEQHVSTLNNNDSLSIPSGGITITAWIKSSNISGEKTILAKDKAEVTKRGNYSIIVADGKLRFGFSQASDFGDNWIDTQNSISPNRWYFVSVTHTFGNSDTTAIYIDGVSQPLSAWQCDWGCDQDSAPTTFTDPLYIGKSVCDGEHFDGSIDEVKIYNRVLSPEEIVMAQLMR